MGPEIVFDDLITAYLFVGGAGAGASFFTAMTCLLMRTRKNAPGGAHDITYLLKPAVMISWLAIMTSMALLIAHLGRIDRVVYLFLRPTASYLTLGTFALTITMVGMSVLALKWVFGQHWIPRIACLITEVITACAAIALMVYTGLLLKDIGPIAFWTTPLIPLLFTASSLSTGIALICVAMVFNPMTARIEEFMLRLLKLDAVIIICELLVLTALLARANQDPMSAPAVKSLLVGELAPVFWLLLIGIGLLAPLALELIVKRMDRRSLLLIGISILIGGLALRWCVINAGLPLVELLGISEEVIRIL